MPGLTLRQSVTQTQCHFYCAKSYTAHRRRQSHSDHNTTTKQRTQLAYAEDARIWKRSRALPECIMLANSLRASLRLWCAHHAEAPVRKASEPTLLAQNACCTSFSDRTQNRLMFTTIYHARTRKADDFCTTLQALGKGSPLGGWARSRVT